MMCNKFAMKINTLIDFQCLLYFVHSWSPRISLQQQTCLYVRIVNQRVAIQWADFVLTELQFAVRYLQSFGVEICCEERVVLTIPSYALFLFQGAHTIALNVTKASIFLMVNCFYMLQQDSFVKQLSLWVMEFYNYVTFRLIPNANNRITTPIRLDDIPCTNPISYSPIYKSK